MAEPHLEHPNIKIRTLIEDYRAGRIVIPEFQRDYVWRKSKAPKLIDSLYHGFPVSSLLVWQSNEPVRSRRKDPRPSRAAGAVGWLIDGQQRVITLARTIAGDEGINVVFNPRDQQFRLANAATERDRNWFPVAEILDDDSYRQMRRNFDPQTSDRHEERFDHLRKILDYEIPVVRMVDHTFNDAVQAFVRINTLGVRLKQEDIHSAEIAAKHSGFIAEQVAPFLEEIRRQGFSRLNIMHLFRACAFIAQPDGRNRTPLHELSRKDLSAAWARTERATKDAVGIVRSELGLVNMDVLWSGSLLVPVIALCANLGARDRNNREIVGWMSLAMLLHRYSGASETSLDQDLRACRADDPVRALLGNLRQTRAQLVARPTDFTGSLADKSGLMAMYVACMHRGVKDFYSGSKIVLQRSVDQHHILPRAQFTPKARPSADCIANIAFISGQVNKSIGHSGPEVYLKRLSSDILDSQCIPANPALWNVERADDFWNARRELLAVAFNEYVGLSLSGRKL